MLLASKIEATPLHDQQRAYRFRGALAPSLVLLTVRLLFVCRLVKVL
jgi:hypothetical protein